MTVVWLVFGFFRKLIFSPRDEKALAVRVSFNRRQVLSRLKKYSFYMGRNISKWEDIPVVNKRQYLCEFKKLNVPHFDLETVAKFSQKMEQTHDPKKKLEGYTVGLSTGTSGTRGAFILGDREIGLWAGSILARTLGWNIFLPQKIAFVFRTYGPLYEGVSHGWIRMRFFDINRRADEIDEELRRWQPTILISVPYFFSQYISRNSHVCIQPKSVFSCADVLDAIEKKRIEEYFKTTVREIYQATEGFLGISCDRGQLHLNEDDYIFEKKIIDETRFYPIVTDVQRNSQAIIRYELDDILVERKSPCICGRPGIVLERIEGRSDQVLCFKSQISSENVAIYPDLIRSVLRDGGWYDWNYLVTQTSLTSMIISLDKVLKVEDALKLTNHFKSVLYNKGVEKIDIEIKLATEFPELRGKRRRIVGLS